MGLRVLCFLAVCGLCVNGQGVAPLPDSTDAVLQAMASRAGVIFAGTVESVARVDAAGYVDVRFRVEEPVRGCRKGVYVLREWAGLWNGPPRYIAGQRRLMLLLPRGPSGMNSPVDGMAGVIPLLGTGVPAIVKGGIVPVDQATGAGAQGNADLRWVHAGATRAGPAQAVSGGVHPGVLSLAGGGTGWTGAVVPLGTDSATDASYAAVLGILRSSGGVDGTR